MTEQIQDELIARDLQLNLSGAQVGQVLTRRVAVRVTDADGLVDTAELLMRIHITPVEDDDFPPICRVKPWLPQCQEPLERVAGLRRGEPSRRSVESALLAFDRREKSHR